MAIFKKNPPSEVLIFAPADGEVMELHKVANDLFSSKILGDGVAFMPTSEVIYAPVNGTILLNYDVTKHGYVLQNNHGWNILLIMGSNDTDVDENTPHLNSSVVRNQSVTKHDILFSIDNNYFNQYQATNKFMLHIIFFTESLRCKKPIMQIIKHNNIKQGDAFLKVILQ